MACELEHRCWNSTRFQALSWRAATYARWCPRAALVDIRVM